MWFNYSGYGNHGSSAIPKWIKSFVIVFVLLFFWRKIRLELHNNVRGLKPSGLGTTQGSYTFCDSVCSCLCLSNELLVQEVWVYKYLWPVALHAAEREAAPQCALICCQKKTKAKIPKCSNVLVCVKDSLISWKESHCICIWGWLARHADTKTTNEWKYIGGVCAVLIACEGSFSE